MNQMVAWRRRSRTTTLLAVNNAYCMRMIFEGTYGETVIETITGSCDGSGNGTATTGTSTIAI
jgi:hypothetical protein